MPKTLTGEVLELDDAPARESELFLVDGNNLAYRAYFALPEELATTEGFPTNALLGFTNMLFKLLSDYRPKGVAVAWDTRPVHRAAISEEYKEGRRPMPDRVEIKNLEMLWLNPAANPVNSSIDKTLLPFFFPHPVQHLGGHGHRRPGALIGERPVFGVDGEIDDPPARTSDPAGQTGGGE